MALTDWKSLKIRGGLAPRCRLITSWGWRLWDFKICAKSLGIDELNEIRNENKKAFNMRNRESEL